MDTDNLIHVFECPDPNCRCRVLKQVVHCPVVRPVAFIEKKDDVKFSNEECCPDDIIWLMDENWDDDPKSTDYFYCAQCAKEWPSMFEGENSVKASDALKQIPREQYGRWLETEYEHSHKYSWEIREQISTRRFMLILYRDDVVFGMYETWSPDIAGEWWCQLGAVYPNPEVFAWEEDCECEDEDLWEEHLKGEYSDENSIVIVKDNNYNENSRAILAEEVHWCWLKNYATLPGKTEFTITKVPAWSICFLVNADMDNMTDEELLMAKSFDEQYNVTSVSPTTTLTICPWTGLAADCYEVICTTKNKTNTTES